MTQFILAACFAATLAIDLTGRARSGSMGKKTGWIYGGMMFISFSVFLLSSFDVNLPSPIEPIQILIERWIGL